MVEKEGRQKQLVDIKLRSPNDIVQIMIGGFNLLAFVLSIGAQVVGTKDCYS